MGKGVNALVWNMFENSGYPSYYLMYAALAGKRGLNDELADRPKGTLPRELDERLR